jgi:hypothetical protein
MMVKPVQVPVIRQLRKIFLASNRHCDGFVEPSVLEAWRIRVMEMPLAPRDFCAEAPFFIPLPTVQLAEPYQQRLHAECFADDDDDSDRDEDSKNNGWPLAMAPEWRGSSAVPTALLQWLLRMLGVIEYNDGDGLQRLCAWEWQMSAEEILFFCRP